MSEIAFIRFLGCASHCAKDPFRIQPLSSGDDGGTFTLGPVNLRTLEYTTWWPWEENRPRRSCMPTGLGGRASPSRLNVE